MVVVVVMIIVVTMVGRNYRISLWLYIAPFGGKDRTDYRSLGWLKKGLI